MTGFFAFSSVLTSFGLLSAIVMGFQGSGYHLMVALFSAVAGVSLHCLVFGIFTGAGKDTRELSEDLKLSREYFEKIKVFRKTNFPKALYAILLLMAAIFLGGAVTVRPSPTLGLVHGLFSSAAVLYNLYVFFFETKSIRENARLLGEVNRLAGSVASGVERKTIDPEIDLEPVQPLEWNQHVRAFGKFLIFLGANLFLPFIYMHYIMGMDYIPFWPFLVSAIALVGCGYVLKTRYSFS